MSEEASGFYTLEKVDSKTVRTTEREVSGKKYQILYRELNGDQYERCLYDANARSNGVEETRQKLLSELIRVNMLVKVAGEDYKLGNEVFWPAWILVDVNNFIIGYLKGNM
jgi:hypothetical protein